MDAQSRLAAFFFFGVLGCLYAEPALLWREALGGTAISEISAQSGSIVAVCEGGSIKAFGTNGTVFWNYKENGRFLPFLSRSREAASYVFRSNGDFLALNRAGVLQWRVTLNDAPVAPALSGWDQRVFIFLKKQILCYTASGWRLWQKSLSSPIVSEPLLDADGACIFLLEDNSLLKVNAFGRIAAIQLSAAPAFILPLAAAKASRGGRTLVIYSDGRLEMYDAAGTALGNLAHLGAAPLAAASQGSAAAVQLASGHLVLFDADSGDLLWRVASQPGIGAAENRAQKIKILFDEKQKSIYVLSISNAAGFAKDGSALWNLRLENASVTPGFDKGMLYSGAQDWILYAYKAENRAPAEIRASLPPPGTYRLGVVPARREWSQISAGVTSGFDSMLDAVVKTVESHQIGEDEMAITRLLAGITSDITILQTERIKAVKLLGRLGSTEIIPFLVRRFLQENASSVKAEIALALGSIGSDPDGRVFDAFERVIKLNRPVRDETLLVAIAAATGTMCRFSGPPISERGVHLLVLLAGDSSSSSVQQQARHELDLLSR